MQPFVLFSRLWCSPFIQPLYIFIFYSDAVLFDYVRSLCVFRFCGSGLHCLHDTLFILLCGNSLSNSFYPKWCLVSEFLISVTQLCIANFLICSIMQKPSNLSRHMLVSCNRATVNSFHILYVSTLTVFLPSYSM
jgi:hypothetical protein